MIGPDVLLFMQAEYILETFGKYVPLIIDVHVGIASETWER
jgi:hypothetical protein